MDCLICGRPSLPGANLCADCRAARKRAFAATVAEPLLSGAARRSSALLLHPSQSVAATVRRAAERALVADPRARDSVARLRATDFLVVAAAIAAVLISGAYAAYRLPARPAAATLADAPPPAPVDVKAATTAASVEPMVTAAFKSTGTAEAPSPPSSEAPAPDTVAKPAVSKRPAPKQRAAEAPAPPASSPAQQIAAAQAPAPALVAPSPPPPNRWQSMSDSLAQCGNGDLIDRVMCDLRVRQQFCNGYWGRVPQCPSGAPTEHGQ